jgi:hypothetical protein
VLAAAAVLPAAWTVRNAIELDAFVPVATNNGVQLLLGNNENASPGSGVNVDISRYYPRMGLGEVEENRHYLRAARDWIEGHKGEAATLYLRKVANYWAYKNRLFVSSESTPARDRMAAFTYLPLLALFVLRLALAWRWRPSSLEILLMAVVVGNAFVMAVYTTRVRYRIPFDSLMIVVVAGFLAGLAARASSTIRTTQAP